jgi:ADP-ribose pyrophosphatase
MGEPTEIEVVEDRTARSRCEEGFLRLRRLVLKTRYADGATSPAYPYDVVSRPEPDAVSVAVHDRAPDGTRRVALRASLRPPVWLRRGKALVQPGDANPLVLLEVPAGILEAEDAGPGGVERRAAGEVREELGFPAEPAAITPLGPPLFPSPGITDELVHFRALETDLSRPALPPGDGSVVERDGVVVVLPLAEALARCRDGRIRDMKTVVALLRLEEALRGR